MPADEAANAIVAPLPVPTPPPPAQRSEPAKSEAAEEPRLTVEGEGLRWFLASGAARPLPFGSEQALVLGSLERIRGAATRGKNEECGAGPVDTASWPDGLSLIFQEGKFAGWALDQRSAGRIATANGIGPGMRRTALDASGTEVRVFASSLGTEFAAGDLFGLLDGPQPDARVTNLWAGVSCAAR